LATHRSAIKRARQNIKRRMRNRGYKTRVKNVIKEVKRSVQKGDRKEAEERLRNAVSIIQKTASKGVIHWRNAARKVSKLTRMVNAMAVEKEKKSTNTSI